ALGKTMGFAHEIEQFSSLQSSGAVYNATHSKRKGGALSPPLTRPRLSLWEALAIFNNAARSDRETRVTFESGARRYRGKRVRLGQVMAAAGLLSIAYASVSAMVR